MKTALSTTVLGICAIATIGITVLVPSVAYADGPRDSAPAGHAKNVFEQHGVKTDCEEEEFQSVPEPSGLLGLSMLGMMGIATYKLKHNSAGTEAFDNSELPNV